MPAVEKVPTWKKYRHASPEAYEHHKRSRTLANWKKSYGFDIPMDKFENFKENKKLYIQLRQIKEKLDKDILALILAQEF